MDHSPGCLHRYPLYEREPFGAEAKVRPQEVSTSWEGQTMVTTAECAGGSISAALSFNTFDSWFDIAPQWDFHHSVRHRLRRQPRIDRHDNRNSDRFERHAVLAAYANTHVRLVGFALGVNSQVAFCTAATTSVLTLTPLSGNFTPETPAAATGKVRGGSLINSNLASSLYIQMKLASALWLKYPGSAVTGFTLSGSLGQFMTLTFNLLAAQELNDTSGTAPSAAPTGTVHNTVGNFQNVYWNQASTGYVIDQVSLTATAVGAAAQYGMGSSIAAGMLPGTINVSGSFRAIFKDFVTVLAFQTGDSRSSNDRDPRRRRECICLLPAAGDYR